MKRSIALVATMAVVGAAVAVAAPAAWAGSISVHGVTVTWDDASLVAPAPINECTQLRVTYTNSATDVENILVYRGDVLVGPSVKPNQAPPVNNAASGTMTGEVCRVALVVHAMTEPIRLVVNYGGGKSESATGTAKWTDPYADPNSLLPNFTVHTTNFMKCRKGTTWRVFKVEGKCPTGWKYSAAWPIESLDVPPSPTLYSENAKCVNVAAEKAGKVKRKTVDGIVCPKGWRIDDFTRNSAYWTKYNELLAKGQITRK